MKVSPPHAVLQLVSSAGLYGAERVVLELAAYWRQLGWRSEVGVFQHRGLPTPLIADEARRRGLDFKLFPVNGRLDAAAVARLGRHVERQGIELVHSHGYKTDAYLGLCALPRRVRRVATCHTWYSRSAKLLFYELVDKLLLHRFDRVAVVSPQLLQEVLAAGIDPDRCALIENGLQPQPASSAEQLTRLRQSLGLQPGEKMILRVGRLDADKGNDLLLRAAAPLLGLGRARLLLAGDGEDRAPLEALAGALGVAPQVGFLGYRQDIADLLAACDLFVISSPKEGLPMVLLEAMAASCPIVSTAVGAIPTVIEDGVQGRLVPVADLQALRAALQELLDSPKLASQMGRRAQQRFEQAHSRRAMGERYRILYEQLLEGRDGPADGRSE